MDHAAIAAGAHACLIGGPIPPIAVAPTIQHSARTAAFCHWYGFSRRMGSLLAVLFEAEGRPRTADGLATLTLTTPRAIQEQIRLLRISLDSEAVDFAPGTAGGYSLTDVGIAECREALRQMQEALAA